ncbi:L-threonylcarbamoyladenylate synthase [Janthinobacterium psychrotolerans]|uniref:Threonylcarbamoyl-AMP synthase n=1 Tax=Janthinobacterium psychrotolerans TaxID=1747903 RepID=A0A1A7C7X0_9BURK|nr:L-threonylcarbamoyladenylate synthase [Janthinobacterium psychrotolerans]
MSVSITAAAALLEAGALVAFPTETVYGLGADAENPQAVARIYQAKGRPSDHPVIVHVAPGADLAHWCDDLPPQATQLVTAFWPGPLTLIVKRAAHIPDAVSGGQDTVGLRCPSHPVAIELLAAFKGGKGGVAAPSANKFGNVSPTTAQHVRDEFQAELDSGLLGAVLDGGQSAVGIESTIVDLSRLATHGPVLLRPGHISGEQIAAVIGQLPALPDAAAPRASGTLDSHYAPHTPVAMQHADLLGETLNQLLNAGRRVALIHYSEMPPASASVRLAADPASYAHALYASLRTMDQVGAELILVEAPPTGADWLGVNDRLRRAAFGSTGILQQFLGL